MIVFSNLVCPLEEDISVLVCGGSSEKYVVEIPDLPDISVDPEISILNGLTFEAYGLDFQPETGYSYWDGEASLCGQCWTDVN